MARRRVKGLRAPRTPGTEPPHRETAPGTKRLAPGGPGSKPRRRRSPGRDSDPPIRRTRRK
eukprot:13153786-Heterocapsa_arctica.AAC.1